MGSQARTKRRNPSQKGRIIQAVRPDAQSIVKSEPDTSLPEKMEELLIGGNLGAMSVDQRVVYYNKLCKSLGLNPLTRPFEYLMLNGKMVLYALRACTEQLRKIHGVSVTKETRKIEDEHCIVDVEVMDRTGRTDTGTGVVWIGNLKGDNYANALMKASTKAKRRATLSIVGLGFLDESELDTMRGAFKRVTPAGRIIEESENKYLDAYHEREQEELSRLTPAQQEVLKAKMESAGAEPRKAVQGTGGKPEATVPASGSTSGNDAEVEIPPAPITLGIRFYQASGTYQILGVAALADGPIKKRALKHLNKTSRTIVCKDAIELDALKYDLEKLGVQFQYETK